ncbi:MAG: bis(5'-nucleosyl)-tetraphosphatase (symmetrical) [Nitrosospira sp. 56-18]|jgi:bis(5'-nucleosyl)-tetraphosphatase (symmetrical)|nr:symmetrical bis(5'-nucleosyl)-tetraphosphatase [Nitrosospira sp.]OJY14875.1 MAG: bis(5'-nucleosyl)-tetraphosphatase (symmetrical) [Nitrosospira sp. 56-18]
MTTFVIGDVQGCYAEFRQLLDLIRFDRTKDKLWLVGDIVNRGPDSLSVLRYVKALDETAVMVLGNHDLHLLMVAEGCGKMNRNDTLGDILAAPDRDELLCWLRRRPLLHINGDYVMVHAGLLPSWSIGQASQLAKSVENALRGNGFHELCAHMYGNQPDHWDENLEGYERLRVVINAMTRMRVCTPDGKMNFAHKGLEKDIPQGYVAWFEAPGRASREATILCGHWSALGLKITDNVLALDTGCLWGGSLTAIRLDDRKIFQVPCAAGEGTRQWQ